MYNNYYKNIKININSLINLHYKYFYPLKIFNIKTQFFTHIELKINNLSYSLKKKSLFLFSFNIYLTMFFERILIFLFKLEAIFCS